MPTGGRRRRRGGADRPKAKKKRKRTKYLSLSRIIVKAEEEVQTPPPWAQEEEAGQQQADPFAPHHDASALFAASPAPPLSDILGSPSPPSASSDGVSGGAAAKGQDLARRALRGRERWVYRGSGASSSPSASPCSSAASTAAPPLLKLDYREILAAWAGRGSLYIGAAAPKREPEPDLHSVVSPPSGPLRGHAAPTLSSVRFLWCDSSGGAVCAGVGGDGAAAATGGGGREGGARAAVQGEAAQPAVRQADPLRGSPAQCCQAAAVQGDANIST
jgi:hypothetical protein